MLNFGNVDTKIPLPNSAARVLSYVPECGVFKKKKKSNCSNAIAEIGKKRNIFFGNCGNGIGENGEKKCGSEIRGE